MGRKKSLIRLSSVKAILILIVVVLGVLVVNYISRLSSLSNGARASIDASIITISPKALDSSLEVTNPLRGLYKWRGVELAKSVTPSTDAYQRYDWNQLESSNGQFNWKAIDADIQNALSSKQMFAFRVRAMTSATSGKAFMPTDLISTEYGWYSGSTFIPDWNNPVVIDRMRSLLLALGQHLRDKGYIDKIAWMDIGMFGSYGEWATMSSIYPSSCSASRPGERNCPASDTNLNKIVDMHFEAFPEIRKLMMIKTYANPVIRALSKSDQVGWRVDCLGQKGYFDFDTNPRYTPFWPYLENRWKTAPAVVEYCSSNISFGYPGSNADDAYHQILKWHISAVGNGNVTFTSTNTESRFLENGRRAGYRYRIGSVTFPTQLMSGIAFTITTQWMNEGNAPTYEPWSVFYQLKGSSGQVVWEGKSSLDLRYALPGELVVTDEFTLPSVTDGNYNLTVVIKDSRGIRPMLKLTQENLLTDGSYHISNVSVNSSSESTPTPSPTASPTASPTPTPQPITDSEGPIIVINSPESGATIVGRERILISATANDSSGVASIELWFNDSRVQSCRGKGTELTCSTRYRVSNNLSSGAQTITVVSYDNSTAKNSSKSQITVYK